MVQAAPEQGEYVAVTAVDGIARINAYRLVRGHDLYLLVGLPETDFPKGWNRVDASVLGLALTAIAAAFLTVLTLLQRSRRAIDLVESRCEPSSPPRATRSSRPPRTAWSPAGTRPPRACSATGPTRCWANRWPACSRPSAWPRS
jgi:hypothetical protein